jgi:hypothetical protein
MPEFDGFFTREDIKKRGWRYGTINSLLSQPSKTVLVDGKSVPLYRQEVVIQMESSPEFEKVQAHRGEVSRQRAAEQIGEAKRDKAEIPTIPKAMLREEARQEDNRKNHRDIHHIPVIVPPGFWDRIEVDYLIKQRSWTIAWDYYRSNPLPKAQEIRMEKTIVAIARAYPHLVEECKGRLKKMFIDDQPRLNQLLKLVENEKPAVQDK